MFCLVSAHSRGPRPLIGERDDMNFLHDVQPLVLDKLSWDMYTYGYCMFHVHDDYDSFSIEYRNPHETAIKLGVFE
jgi:hypothetical protein